MMQMATLTLEKALVTPMGSVTITTARLIEAKLRRLPRGTISCKQELQVNGTRTNELFSQIRTSEPQLEDTSWRGYLRKRKLLGTNSVEERGHSRVRMVHTKTSSIENGSGNILAFDKHYRTDTKDSLNTMAKLIDGKQISADIRAELHEQIEKWMAKGNRAPQLTAILIGDDPASNTYVSNKMKAAADVGINSKTERYGADITEEELLARIEALNQDDSVDGILVQLPVPGHINERKVCNSVSCDKDVDGFNERNVGRLCLDMNTLIPCTPLGVQELIKRCQIETFGKNAVVVGRSKNVGMPIAMLLHADGRNDTCAMDATVTICHRFTPPEELARFCRSADIIVTATGVPGLIRGDMIKEGAAVIDVGITRVTDPATGKTKLVGDVDFEEARKVAGYITPVPGGVGPMTVAMLMKNTFIAAKNLASKKVKNLSRSEAN
uniref:methenyltetrahydrofolate cyclohydrolase n=1 Tax=Culex pipiens TaxID=7175 RepID=A0A8D8A2W3_CULPI